MLFCSFSIWREIVTKILLFVAHIIFRCFASGEDHESIKKHFIIANIYVFFNSLLQQYIKAFSAASKVENL